MSLRFATGLGYQTLVPRWTDHPGSKQPSLPQGSRVSSPQDSTKSFWAYRGNIPHSDITDRRAYALSRLFVRCSYNSCTTPTNIPVLFLTSHMSHSRRASTLRPIHPALEDMYI